MNLTMMLSAASTVLLAKADKEGTLFGIPGFWELAFFGCAAFFIVACGLGVILARKAVHTAVCMMFIMLGLAALYVALQAPFMAMAQIVVYTGAIMMLFLFVIMLVGRNATDEAARGRTSLKIAAAALGLALAGLMIGGIWFSDVSGEAGLANANAKTNPVGVAQSIFFNHVFAMELAGVLLVVAAVGALTLAHRDATAPKLTQEELAEQKMRAYAASAARIGQLPPPGVYAESNAVDVPAIGPQGSIVQSSVSRVLQARGAARSVGEVSASTAHRLATARFSHADATGNADVTRSGAAGMPGPAGPPPAVQLAVETPANPPEIDQAQPTPSEIHPENGSAQDEQSEAQK